MDLLVQNILIFQKLAGYKTEQIFQVLQGESPQTVSIILSRLEPKIAKNVLSNFSPDEQKDIAYRIATSASVDVDILNQIAKGIQDKLKVFDEHGIEQTGGSDKIAKILNALGDKTGSKILSDFEKKDVNLASRIKDKMFTFQDILNVDDRPFKKALFEIPNAVLALALKGESKEMKVKIISNISENRKKIVLEEYNSLGPQKRQIVDDAKDRILDVLRKLKETGELFFKVDDKDDEWV
ncbi:FliG C-terminal domain-containing protein [candidate division KSB1 bacterium]